MVSSESLLKNIDKIKEETFRISSKRKLYNKLFKRSYYNPKYGEYAYAVYTDDKKFIRGYQVDKKEGPRKSFKKALIDFVKLYNPSSYKDFLFFMSAYPVNSKDPSMLNLLNRKFKKYEIVDCVLEDSHGFLLWGEQLKQLLILLGDRGWKEMKEKIESNPIMRTTTDAYFNLRTGLFLGSTRKYYLRLMKKLKFSKNYSMYDVIKERAVKQLNNPDIGRAYLLYKTMTQ